MAESLHAKLEELATLKARVSTLQADAYKEFESLLTRKNFAEMMNNTFWRLEPLTGSVKVTFTGFDWADVHSTSEAYLSSRDSALLVRPDTIRVEMKNDATVIALVNEYVSKVWRGIFVGSIHLIGDRIRCSYELLSKAKWQTAVHGVASVVEEDVIETAERYLAYLLYHDIGRARIECRSCIKILKISEPDPVAEPDVRRQGWDRMAHIRYPEDRFGITRQFNHWRDQYRISMWCNLHDRLLELHLALAPLRLTPYELLWILDYVSPMDFRCYREGVPYDPNHTLKLRLFESVAASYQKLKMG
jgi:hypothetical protein